eukprot:SM000288S10778  [mRNA]  locus=s288:72626:75122:+ [translate_table: standard]
MAADAPAQWRWSMRAGNGERVRKREAPGGDLSPQGMPADWSPQQSPPSPCSTLASLLPQPRGMVTNMPMLLLLLTLAALHIHRCEGVKEELDYAILNDESGEMFYSKQVPAGTTNGDDCILVHHTGCTAKARWQCVTCESGDHVEGDPFMSCHVSFEPMQGASLVRLTCKAVSHLTEGISTLIDTGYYPKNFPTALRKCTWPHERVPPKRPHRLSLCNDTQRLFEGLRRERLLKDDAQCAPAGAGKGCVPKKCKAGQVKTVGKGCGCEGNCCGTGKNKGEPCLCSDVGVVKGTSTSICECKAQPANPICDNKLPPGAAGKDCELGVCKNNVNCTPNKGCIADMDKNMKLFCRCSDP